MVVVNQPKLILNILTRFKISILVSNVLLGLNVKTKYRIAKYLLVIKLFTQLKLTRFEMF